MEAEKRDERVALDLEELSGRRVLERHRLDFAVAPHAAHLGGDADADRALLLERARLLHGGLERTEPLAPVDERDRQTRRVLEAERPVERGVASADDHAGLVAEDLLPSDEVVEPAALPVVDVIDLELAGLERAVTRRDDQHAGRERLALVGGEDQLLLAVDPDPLEILHLLVQEDLGAELEALLDTEVDEGLALDLRVAGDVVDVLLRVDGSHLAAELAEALDDPDGGISMPCVVRDSEPNGAGADDR